MRVSNYQSNCLKRNKNNNSDKNNKLTESVDNKIIRCKIVDSNSNKDVNNDECVALTYIYTKNKYQESISTPLEYINLLGNLQQRIAEWIIIKLKSNLIYSIFQVCSDKCFR